MAGKHKCALLGTSVLHFTFLGMSSLNSMPRILIPCPASSAHGTLTLVNPSLVMKDRLFGLKFGNGPFTNCEYQIKTVSKPV